MSHFIAYERNDNSLVVEHGRLWGILHRDGNLLPNLKHERKQLERTIEKHKHLLPTGWEKAAEKMRP